MRNKLIKLTVFGAYFTIGSVTFATPLLPLQEISTVGPTFSTKPYLQDMSPNIGTTLGSIGPVQIKQVAKVPTTVRFNYLPVKSPSLTPGKVKPRAINFPQLPHPVFLVGSDQNSILWLDKYAPRLQQLRAVGLLVQADTKEDIERVNQAAHGVTVVPASGEQMAKRFGIKHYPVLISKTTIEQ